LPEIQHVYPLIHNKVTSPHYVTPTLRRARLMDWLDAMATCRAIVIAADAGYGKTTLLWQWEREVEFPCYWYKLDRNDRDWSLHISYLIESISQRHPGFGRRAHSMLEQLGGPGSSRPGVAAYLLAEMYEKLTDPCTFIIDDWQFVASVTEVRGLWNQILRDAPPTCRFVFLSRGKPQLQFARFKTHGGYAEMRTDALRFTDHEIEELFRDIYNDPLDSVDVAELERRTEGWAASLQLVEVSLRERRRPEERRAFIQSITADTESDLVEFLAQEVLDQQTPATRNFLLAAAVLRQIHPALAASLSGLESGHRLLEELENGGLFTYRLDDTTGTYRFHGIFRDFLLRRLEAERSEGEIAALHIHAASYFETHALWPEAIHHYMAAGLQPQAARLIAKYGEDLVSTGRLPIVEEWLHELPGKTVHGNARLSLLRGEVFGVAGDWKLAFADLARARKYFAGKGDSRMEAVACSKLSTVYNNYGDTVESARLAREGLELAPADAHATRIRLRGNLAVTATFFESFVITIRECKRVAVESAERGYEQFAAIAHHNLGALLRDAGHLEEGLANLYRAARYWEASPTNPFADCSELVLTLLALGRDMEALSVAESAVVRTRPWRKANAEARLGLAAVYGYQGRFGEAVEVLRDLADRGDVLGSAREKALALFAECVYLGGGEVDELVAIEQRLSRDSLDPRLALTTAVGKALIAHRQGKCKTACREAYEVVGRWRQMGAEYAADRAELPLAVLAIDHDVDRGLAAVSSAAGRFPAIDGSAKWWLRRISNHIGQALLVLGVGFLGRLLESDPDYWLPHAAASIPLLSGGHRQQLLDAIQDSAKPEAIGLLRGLDGADVQEVRRVLVQRSATRIFIRSFGALAIHRGNWNSPPSIIGRRRIRLLLGLLVANYDGGLTRDQAIDALWPEADPASAINSLNQTVFQLRRLIEPSYREGESAQYVISNVDAVQLNRDLVVTDLAVMRQLRDELLSPANQAHRTEVIHQLVDLVRGEYLADLKYEDWVSQAQMRVHSEVRGTLLPIAQGDILAGGDEWAFKAGCALVSLDAYDEEAHVAMVRHLSASGRRGQARTLAHGFAERLRTELEEEPSQELILAARIAGETLTVQ
jgi:ATP/maltotriose-dependent transcriptional regulator MalT/DNA-binding SARP family transcriptional activator